jgi:hypothetical protein
MSKRLGIVSALLLVLAAVLAHRSPPAIFSTQTVPVPADELLRLNPD